MKEPGGIGLKEQIGVFLGKFPAQKIDFIVPVYELRVLGKDCGGKYQENQGEGPGNLHSYILKLKYN